ncbi:exported protein [Nitrincola lacisaponensis]|uniref:Exported protein n=1 Tax=Nitrincola lacisaponensis TaxID=267850 RepID=A0A063Y4Z5_9GAMM|nr:DUF192 domain-containing protein [Nitrincola lacisaponensis]KDE40220.1 exported protein [Nitrincola lacisaponensis]
MKRLLWLWLWLLPATLLANEFIVFKQGEHQLLAEVALTPSQRSQGLMWRTEMPENGGMLFILDPQPRQCFWMRNTYIPLTLAFLDQDFRILQFNDMTPLSDELHCAEQTASFALETHQGWFSQRDIQIGSYLEASLP